ncbi:hypothetical protein C8R45DRAFT_958791 [Mycena sanguinolenta]|nr:hypothetical protein C8R45DRAFT_958791 [Mycena sanguinolenta]
MEPDSGDFFSNILTPGSSLHPKFLLAVDITFTALFFILVALAFLTAGNIHIFALIAIELALWASVKCPIPAEAGSKEGEGESKADESKKNS